MKLVRCNYIGGGFKYFLFSPLFGEMIQFDDHIFQRGWNHQLGKYSIAMLNYQRVLFTGRDFR